MRTKQMTQEDIICHKGKCEYAEKSFLDKCENCTEPEIIEHEMLKKEVKSIY